MSTFLASKNKINGKLPTDFAGFLHTLLFHQEDGSSVFLRIVDELLPNYTAFTSQKILSIVTCVTNLSETFPNVLILRAVFGRMD
jgi:hypothetical protein